MVFYDCTASLSLMLISGSLDREAQDSYALVVLAIDYGSPPLTGSATVYITVADDNDEKPYFNPRIPECYIHENSPLNSPVTFQEWPTLKHYTFDKDIAPNGAPFTYSMTSTLFGINSTSGGIYTKTSTLDFEQTREYLVPVNVMDRGGQTAQLQVKVSYNARGLRK